MSFMYNPYPYDDPRAINKPVLAPQTIESVTAGTPQAAVRLAREFAETLKATPQRNLIVAFDGYTTADWTRTINLLSQQLGLLGIGFEAMDFWRHRCSWSHCLLGQWSSRYSHWHHTGHR